MDKQGTLTKGEVQIMNILWSLPSMRATVSEMLKLFDGKKPAYTTVATFMKILTSKGYVGYEILNGTKPKCYFPLVSKEEYTRKVLAMVKDDLFGGSLLSLTRFIIRDGKISEEELKDIFE